MKEMSNAAAERAAAQKALANGELKDRETYTAKQVAMRCGTDAKTMRKFFRSSYSTVEAVGQGGRYEFDARDLPKIQREFKQWLNRAAAQKVQARQAGKSEMPASPKIVDKGMEISPAAQIMADIRANSPEFDELSKKFEAEEPTMEELMELDDLELDLEGF